MLQIIRHIWSYILGIKLEEYTSAVSGKLELWLINGKKVLNSINANYSFDALHKVFQLTFRQVNLEIPNNSHVLILGFGCGSVAHILQKEYGLDCKITGVDLDPLLFELAEKHFDIHPSNKLQFVTADAAKFITQIQQKYNLIVVDIFVDDKVPPIFTEKEFIENTIKCLAPQGMFFMNIITSNEDGLQQFDKVMQTLHDKKGIQQVVEPVEGNSVVCFQNAARDLQSPAK